MIQRLYGNMILRYPLIALVFIVTIVGFLGYYATKLEIDASAETLLIEDDIDLAFARDITKRYHSPNFLVLTFTPNSDLLSRKSLLTIKSISEELASLPSIDSVTSIYNVPLVQSPLKPIQDLVQGVKTLETGDFDMKLVKQELLNSEFYTNNLVSSDFKTTALIINLHEDIKFFELLEQRNTLLAKKRNNTILAKEEQTLKQIIKDFKAHRDTVRLNDKQQIEQIRNIMDNYKENGDMFLGGINMIASDIVGFVKNDLIVYGGILFIVFIAVLWLLFKKVIWIILPLLIAFISVLSTAGILGYFGWEITVISSNFIALQLIITLSITIHLIVRYRELNENLPIDISQKDILIETIKSKISPSFFAVLTTIVGFISLVLSNILPVKNLGLMMSTGVGVSLIIIIVLFPLLLSFLPRTPEATKQSKTNNTIGLIVSIIKTKSIAIIGLTIAIIIFSLSGSTKLIVENSFINYFKKDTAIYQGMQVIDEHLGGTTPLDVIIKFGENTQNLETNTTDNEDDFFDDFEEEFTQDADNPAYWFTQDKMDTIIAVHDYLESLPEIGKVQSLASLLKTGELLNNNNPLDGITLALFYNMFPDEYKDLILLPYIDISNNEARITTRIIDSNPDLRRDEFIKKINEDLSVIITAQDTEYKLSNLMILYNNMLQSLFDSQIKTLGFVTILLLVMFLILFRNITVSIIALSVNIIPILIVFGIMGWFRIPLDVMTITIAAISIGIGVDHSIHYIYRFKEEFAKSKHYINAMEATHQSVGYGMYYTTFIIILGFMVLLLSNLMPTVYFGLLTVIVMSAMLLSSLILLPYLLVTIKPLKDKH